MFRGLQGWGSGADGSELGVRWGKGDWKAFPHSMECAGSPGAGPVAQVTAQSHVPRAALNIPQTQLSKQPREPSASSSWHPGLLSPAVVAVFGGYEKFTNEKHFRTQGQRAGSRGRAVNDMRM